MSKHTPGPWRVGIIPTTVVANTGEGLTVPGSYGERATQYYGGYLIGESVSSNNIDLIAAAPELLDALEQAVSLLELIDLDSPLGTRERKMFNSLIAKAKGQSS